MSMIDLNLGIFAKKEEPAVEKTVKPRGDVTWIKIANMQSSAFAVDAAKRKLVAIVSHDRKVCEAVNILANAKTMLKTYGASESIMAFFNQGNQLGNCIGMEIPEITSVNAKAVGIACCESIDATITSAYDKVKEFFDALISTANNFFDKLKVQTTHQTETINTIIEHVIDNNDKVDNAEFAHNDVFGYTQPVFMDRVNALQFINDHLAVCEANNESMLQFGPALKALGYKIVEKSSEGLMDGEVDQVESELQIVPESAADAPAPAPGGGEGAPAPAAPPAEGAPAGGGEGGAPAPGGGEAPAAAPAKESLGPQKQTMASFFWTPAAVRDAALAIKATLAGSDKLGGVTGKLGEIQGTVVSAIESVSEEGTNRMEADATITSGRRYAAFIGDILAIYSGATNELVDQIVCMSAKLVASSTDEGEAPAGGEGGGEAPAPEGGAPAGGEAPAANEDAPAGGEGGEGAPAAPPAEGGGEGAPAPAANGVESPKGVPQSAPVKPNAPVCPNGEPHPGAAPHVQPVETPESQQPTKKAETLMEDTQRARLW